MKTNAWKTRRKKWTWRWQQ